MCEIDEKQYNMGPLTSCLSSPNVTHSVNVKRNAIKLELVSWLTLHMIVCKR